MSLNSLNDSSSDWSIISTWDSPSISAPKTSSVDANMAETSTSQPKSKGKGKKKKKKDFTKQEGKQIVLGVADKGKKIKGKCFHCGEKGH